MAGRFEGLTDDQWTVLEHLLPPEPEKRKRGMPHAPFRCVINTIFYILVTGARWCDIPSGKSVSGSRSASHRWLVRWSEDGTFHRLCDGVRVMADLNSHIDWSRVSVDGSFSLRKGWR